MPKIVDLNAMVQHKMKVRRLYQHPLANACQLFQAQDRDQWAFYCRVTGETISFEQWEAIHQRDE